MNKYEYKVYKDCENLEDYADDLPAITYNWNVIKVCYGMWRDDIISTRKADFKLHEIAGVGSNYINEICAGRKTYSRRLFNTEMDVELLPYLHGEKWIVQQSCKELKRYVALYILYNMLLALKKSFTRNNNGKSSGNDVDDSKYKDMVLLEEWIRKQCDGEPKDYLKKLEKELIQFIERHPLGKYNQDNKWEPNIYGKLKQYLEGRNTKEVILNESHGKINLLFSAIYQMPYSIIEKLDDKMLGELHSHMKMFMDKVEVEVRLREVKKIEKEFYKAVVQSNINNEREN